MKKKRGIALLILAVGLSVGCRAEAARKADAGVDDHASRASCSAMINADQQTVWDAIEELRRNDPELDSSKTLFQHDRESVLEQRFNNVPVFGKATCRIRFIESPPQQIDYSLVESDLFSKWEGCWQIKSAGRNQSTLELSTAMEPKFFCPQLFLRLCMKRKLVSHVSRIKELAEAHQRERNLKMPVQSVHNLPPDVVGAAVLTAR